MILGLGLVVASEAGVLCGEDRTACDKDAPPGARVGRALISPTTMPRRVSILSLTTRKSASSNII